MSKKPFSPKVLIARIKAVLRRQSDLPNTSAESTITLGGLHIDPTRRQVSYQGKSLDLTFSEFQALELMARKPGWVFTRMQIVQAIHGEDYITTDRTVDVLIVGIRKKLGQGAAVIETVRGVGYRLKD